MAQVQQSGIVLKQATLYTRMLFFGTAGQTLSVALSKAGASFGGSTNAATEVADGWYKLVLATADVNVPGDLAYHVTAGGGGPLDFCDTVVTQVVSDILLDANGNVSIASSIKKNAACNGFMFIMTNNVDHAPQTGLTVTAQRSLAGTGFAPCANPVTELSNGVYVINLAASDTNANNIMFRFTASGADDLDMLIVTQP